MSILIKGIMMPPKGEYHMTLYVCSDGSAYIDVASFPVGEDRFKAVPVPPHGRLVDADKPVQMITPYGKKVEVSFAHIAEKNGGVIETIIEAEE